MFLYDKITTSTMNALMSKHQCEKSQMGFANIINSKTSGIYMLILLVRQIEKIIKLHFKNWYFKKRNAIIKKMVI